MAAYSARMSGDLRIHRRSYLGARVPSYRRSALLVGNGVASAVGLAAALTGIVAVGAYLAIALCRLGYPFTLNGLESNSLIEVHRILSGQQVYAAPTVGYVPDGYPPLYFAVSAASATVLGPSYLPLRLVSLLSSLACLALLGRLVQRETGSARAGIAAAGMLAATYFVTGTWLDVARVDSLFLALSAAALYMACWMRRTRGAVATGALLAAAFLTKQSGLAEGVAILAALGCGPRRRLALPAALTYGGLLAGSTLLLGFISHGWYLYYVFGQMSEERLRHAAVAQFWTVSLLPALGIAVSAAILGARRTPLVLLAGCAALVVEGYAAFAKIGGAKNDLLLACFAAALLAGLAMGGQPGGLLADGVDRLTRTRIPGWPAGHAGRWIGAIASALVITQLGVLLSGFQPSQAIPVSADRLAGMRLVAGMRALGGVVAAPAEPGLGLMAGMPAVAHQGAVYDVVSSADQTAAESFRLSAARAVAMQRFSAIITEGNNDPTGYPPDLNRYYHRCPQILLPSVPPALFLPADGARAPRISVWLPVGHGSCAAAAGLLSGPGAVHSSRRP